MSIKPRSPGQTAISVSLPQSLVDQVDKRAEALGLSRSQYLAQLARADLMDRGDLTLRETPSVDDPQTPPVPSHQTDTSYLKRRKKKS